MLVVDASALFEVVADSPGAPAVRDAMRADSDLAAPHLIDAEVLAAIQNHFHRGDLDRTASTQAVADLIDWPGRRWPHRGLLQRAWDLTGNVRSYDAMYVALAEALDAKLLTLDRRLARAPGIACEVLLPTA